MQKSKFSVDVVESGYAALTYLKDARNPDAVILDLFIPEIGSLISSWPETKIFVYTAHTEWKDMLLRYHEICGFFYKTDGIENLVKAIREELVA